MMYYKVGKVGLAGDWHCNSPWACARIREMVSHLEGEREKLIFQVGDFGFWPGNIGKYYLSDLTKVLEELDAELFFIDGNHENHDLLRKNAKKQGILDKPKPVRITGRITWLQRGTRVMISDKEWLFLGGAASVDRYHRTEGISWFPEERITDDQVELAISGGPADVLISHDAPAFVHINFPHSNWPERDLALSQVNREKLEKVCIETGVEYCVHGHMHMSYGVNTAYRDYSGELLDIRVNCLNCDGEYGNWAILDTNTMDWVTGG
jgi:calcineurin-like phosphoesterase family protein